MKWYSINVINKCFLLSNSSKSRLLKQRRPTVAHDGGMPTGRGEGDNYLQNRFVQVFTNSLTFKFDKISLIQVACDVKWRISP